METSVPHSPRVALCAARSREQLLTQLAQGVLGAEGAEAVAIYVTDATGRNLVPLASQGAFPVSKLPSFALGTGASGHEIIDQLRQNQTFVPTPEYNNQLHQYRLQLFGRNGKIAAIRIGGPSGPAVHYYLFFLYGPDSQPQLESSQHLLSETVGVYDFLRPLIEVYENKDKNIDDINQRRQRNRERLDAILSERLVGISSQIAQVRQTIAKFAPSPFAVLIQGETGTGKELVARALHRLSRHAEGPFVAENISALPEHLIESELFGHVKGAFTGASSDREGLIQRASGGTLFLDEIGDMSLDLQVKLLRVLQEKSVRPLGAHETVSVDFRLITATHHNLRDAASNGSFRSDLYHRIAQLVVAVPPLRERIGDVGYLAGYFLTELAARNNEPAKHLDDSAHKLLQNQQFTGNVRELQNVMIKAAFLTGDERAITSEALNSALGEAITIPEAPAGSGESDLRAAVRAYERKLLYQAFERFNGNRRQMASFLHLPQRTLTNKLHQHNILVSGDINHA